MIQLEKQPKVRSYLLIYSSSFGTREQIRTCLNEIREVISWRIELPSCFFILSTATAQVLAERLMQCRDNKSDAFLITEIASNSQGLLVDDSWTFLQQKPSSDK